MVPGGIPPGRLLFSQFPSRLQAHLENLSTFGSGDLSPGGSGLGFAGTNPATIFI